MPFSVVNAKKVRPLVTEVRQALNDALALINNQTNPPVNKMYNNVTASQLRGVFMIGLNKLQEVCVFLDGLTELSQTIVEKYVVGQEYFVDEDTKGFFRGYDTYSNFVLQSAGQFYVLSLQQIEKYNPTPVNTPNSNELVVTPITL